MDVRVSSVYVTTVISYWSLTTTPKAGDVVDVAAGLPAPRRFWRGHFLSGTMYFLISFRKSTPPQNRQLGILIRNSLQ